MGRPLGMERRLRARSLLPSNISLEMTLGMRKVQHHQQTMVTRMNLYGERIFLSSRLHIHLSFLFLCVYFSFLLGIFGASFSFRIQARTSFAMDGEGLEAILWPR